MSKNITQTEHTRPRRGIYLLPNLFTTAGLFGGFYAMIAAINGEYSKAAAAIFIAMLMDGLDGRIARLTRTQSAFGEQYDSIADMVSFGLAPGLLMYQWAIYNLNAYGWHWAEAGWLCAFVYVVCAALRLARFNVSTATHNRRYFQGLPSPSGAGLLAGSIWFGESVGIDGANVLFVALGITIGAGLLMVSNIPYYSFKDLNLHGRVPFVYILFIPLAFVLIALNPPQTLCIVFLLYSVSGLVIYAWRLVMPRRSKKSATRTKR